MNTPRAEVPARRSHAEELALLRHVCDSGARTLLFASDLHLALGRDPVTGMYAGIENFTADDAFARWLAHHEPEAASTVLVLVGDVFDFLRIAPVPESRADFAAWADRLAQLGEASRAAELRRIAAVPDAERRKAAEAVVGRHEYDFGLQSDDFKTVWKLMLIEHGHAPFFAALGQFVGAGGRVIIVKGNHDVEVYWPLVRQALRVAILAGQAGAGPDAIAFADDCFTLGNLFIEHGHRHEPMTAVVGPPVLAAVPTQINYPLGSFVNRYFINRIERLDAFIDNVKPVTQSLLALLRRRPLTIGRAYWRGWRFVWRALRVRKCKGAGGPVLVITAALFVPPVALGLVILERFVPGWFTWIPAWLKVGGSIAGIGLPMLLPYLLGALGELRKEFGPTRKEPLLAGAEAALRDAFPPGGRPARVYAVMGHTHDQRVDVIGNGAGEAFYLNTGTWTPLWPRDRSDLIGRVYYSFIRFERGVNGEYRHQALVWDDQAGAARAAPMVLFTE